MNRQTLISGLNITSLQSINKVNLHYSNILHK